MEIKSKHIKDIVEVRRFRLILFYELSTSALVFLHYIAFFTLYYTMFFTLYLVIIAAILFTPYMMYVLIKEKRYGWIVIFFFMVVLPYLIVLFINFDNILLTAWLLLPIVLFYLYCFLLKYSVDNWMREYNWEQQLVEQRKEREQREKDYLL